MNKIVPTFSLMLLTASSLANAQTAQPQAGPALSPAPSVAIPAKPASLVDLDARVLVEARSLSGDGILRQTRYEDQLMRRGDHTWTLRILPVGTPMADEHDHDQAKPTKTGARKTSEPDHQHFNPQLAGRHVWLDAGKVRLEFVDTRSRMVVPVAPAEFETVGFDGSWERAYYMVSPREVARMPVTARPSPVAGARWHETQAAGLSTRVLWDDRLGIPRIIEIESLPGRPLVWRRVTVTPAAQLAKAVPWQQTQGYQMREYSDFLD
jgi:hypothetical protein